jgi:hypothetical protein
MERQVTFLKDFFQRRDDCSVAYTDGQIKLREIGYGGTEWMELIGRVQ